MARLDTAPTAYHLGFLLGPRVNAGGRIGRADLGARLLATADPAEAAALAARLDTLNAERREIEARVREAALAQAEARGLDAPLVWAADDGWHPGVVGIVAARLKEAANRPAVVIGFDGDTGKGSGRSVARHRPWRGDPAAGGRGADRKGRRPPHGGGADADPGAAGPGDGAAVGPAGAAGRRRASARRICGSTDC